MRRSSTIAGLVLAVTALAPASGLSADARTLVLIRPRARLPRARTAFAVRRRRSAPEGSSCTEPVNRHRLNRGLSPARQRLARGVPPGGSTVTVTLERVEAGTRLRLVHTGLPHPSLAGHDKGWRGYLSQLAGAAER